MAAVLAAALAACGGDAPTAPRPADPEALLRQELGRGGLAPSATLLQCAVEQLRAEDFEGLTLREILARIRDIVRECRDRSQPPEEPTTGDLEVTTESQGNADPYLVVVSGGPAILLRNVGANDTQTFPDLAPGELQVELRQVPDGCAVEAPNPRPVEIVAGETATTTFRVNCGVASPVGPVGTLVFQDKGDALQDIFERDIQTPDEETRVTHVDFNAQSPDVAPDGRIVYYHVDTSPTEAAIYETSLQGGNGVPIVEIGPVVFDPHTGPVGPYLGPPSYSPDGSDVAYVKYPARGPSFELHTLHHGVVLKDPLLALNRVAWSPDGMRLAYVGGDIDAGQYGLHVVHIGTGAGTLILHATVGDPAWSPLGEWIAYECGSHVCVIRQDGTEPRQLPLAPTCGDARNPDWSPDGLFLVFDCSGGGLWIARITRQGDRIVGAGDFLHVGSGSEPAWVQPDGGPFGPH